MQFQIFLKKNILYFLTKIFFFNFLKYIYITQCKNWGIKFDATQ